MQDKLRETKRKIIHTLTHYRDLIDVYYLKSSWLTNATAAGLLAQHAAWEELAARKIDLDRAIKMLTQRQREVTIRYWILGQMQEEIAQKLGIGRQRVGKHIYAGINKLAKILGESW